MKNTKRIGLGVLITTLTLGAGVATWVAARTPSSAPAQSTSVRPVWDVVYAQSFKVDEPYTHWYRAEQPQVTNGTILVLDVDPSLVVARQSYEPVLYVGAQTAERVNQGDTSGRVVVLVPGSALDLAATEIWFGTPELPERVDAARATEELQLARAAGVTPFAQARVSAARLAGGAALEFADRESLDEHLVQLIERFSPQERDLIRGMRAERLER